VDQFNDEVFGEPIRRRSFLKTASFAAAGTLVRPARSAETSAVWPRRRLMMENLADSMEAKFLAKPVHDFLLIDDMEAEGRWTASLAVTIQYTTERARQGTRSLRFRTPQKRTTPATGSQEDFGSTSAASIQVRFSPPQDWSRFNRISLWCYVHPTRVVRHCLSFRFVCDGAPDGPNDPVSTHFIGGLKPGEWNLLTWEIPEFQRDKVSQFAISRPIWGISKKGYDDEIIYDFDQLRIERVDPKPYEGWEVAPGTIAFNHVGYLTTGDKTALAGSASERKFEILDAASGKSVASFEVKEVSNKRGRFHVLDFTAFTTPGRYQLRCGGVTSRPFSVSDTVWNGTIEKLMNYFYGDRCGFEIPEEHDACHLDVMAVHGGKKVPIAGGWHDAGNLTQGSHRTNLSADAMLRLYEQLRERNLNPKLQARVLEEARWGLEWLMKTRFGDGWRITRGSFHTFTDNRVGTADDMDCLAENTPFESFVASAVAAHAARVFKPMDAAFSAKLLEAAKDDFRSGLRDHKTPPVPGPLGMSQISQRDELGYATLGGVELYRATGEQRYAEEAFPLARQLAGMQEQRCIDGIPITGYYYEDTDHVHIVHDTHRTFEDAPQLAFRALCDVFPAHADWAQWYAAVVLYSEYFLRRGARISEPYGMLPSAVWRHGDVEEWIKLYGQGGRRGPSVEATTTEAFMRGCRSMWDAATYLSDEYRLRAFPLVNDRLGHGNVNVQLAMVGGLAAAAELRSKPELDTLVARQLQWLFGGNPFSQTLMYGEGYDFQRLIATGLPDLVGVMPLGIDGNHDDAPRWTHGSFYAVKDLWVVSSARTILALSHAAIPAWVTGLAPAGANFREGRSGKSFSVRPGKFQVNLPPGDYTIRYGNQTKMMPLVAGTSYRLSLDPQLAVEMDLGTTGPQGNTFKIEARLRGAGVHKIELRTFNGSVDRPESEVKLVAGREQTLNWELTVTDQDKPWIVVAIPDGRINEKKELFGTVLPLREASLTA
jgi:hypothetical protein